ncbi:UDP-N-acetylglucosamine 1-carboxyvinyltransferase [Metallumcola ferriviriculae]|uniref:UDP-N-acetylglucosamine 1-carboxyvinyltransferase n=1 Tax=Metallumcola ferriviriculae TaxID=3039180 RepID=A0AAU0UKW2_9FIRM|nr:UDP-N-acetylglucosamine 1-carboxyvinyltransferase [Desulfitibacteraceae bacterium MK1]
MNKIVVSGGRTLQGKVTVSGAKNAVLPIIAATLLAEEGKSIIEDTPRLTDVETIYQVLRHLGVKVTAEGSTLTMDAGEIPAWDAPYEYVRQMRASFLITGPLLARTGHARLSLPGGCSIGSRPIDLHLKGLAALGAQIEIGHGIIDVYSDGLKGNRIYLDFPSVGATENIMMAAALAQGSTIIENVAEEPEIVDLANFLNSMGGHVTGAGTNIIKVDGAKVLRGATHTVIPDRIEAGTFMVAVAAAGGDVLVANVIEDHLKPVVAKLKEAGVEITEESDGIRVKSGGRLYAVDVKTLPYPGFPTDMQAQFMALMAVCQGTSIVTETVFENRFMHVNELKRMGANVNIEGHSAVVKGVQRLTGAPVKATDLRAGAALIIAGLVAEGNTEIGCTYHIYRGYEDIVEKFNSIGADIRRAED